MVDDVRIFVSHSHQDNGFTNQLVKDLRRAGASVWVDMSNIGAGDFQSQVNDGLSKSNWVVLVLTKPALQSPWVQQEINAAIRLKNQGLLRDIIPIQAHYVHMRYLPPLWGVFNIIDASEHYQPARDHLMSILGLTLPPPTGSTSEGVERAKELVVEGMARSSDKKYKEALAAFDHAIALDKSYARAWGQKAWALFYLRRYDEALAAIDKALRIEPGSGSYYFQKYMILTQLGREEEAAKAYRRSVDTQS